MPPKVRTLLGFAKRSGALLTGQTAVEACLQKRQAELVLTALDMPEKRRLHLEHWCGDLGVKFYCLATKEDYGNLLGVAPLGVLAISNRQLAHSIIELLESEGSN